MREPWEYTEKYITYKWDASPHARDIDRAAQRYIIYLRKSHNDYFSAVHGSGVWDVYLDIDNYEKSIIVNDFILKIPESLFECVRFCGDDKREIKITLNTLFLFFDKNLNMKF